MAREPLAFTDHDHGGCVASMLAEAERVTSARGQRLTPVRRRVLEILLEEHAALGAYDVLDRLKAEGLGAHPPVAYRALDWLVNHGLVHRIERLNAFVACARPGCSHDAAFMICRVCGLVAEAGVAPLRDALQSAARASGFGMERVSVEIEGLCPQCQDSAAQ